jgi:hypothetical protein
MSFSKKIPPSKRVIVFAFEVETPFEKGELKKGE